MPKFIVELESVPKYDEFEVSAKDAKEAIKKGKQFMKNEPYLYEGMFLKCVRLSIENFKK